MMGDRACAVEPNPFHLRDLPRFLWQFKVEKIGRYSNAQGSGWRLCIRRRGPVGMWANCPGPTLRAALGCATRHSRRGPR